MRRFFGKGASRRGAASETPPVPPPQAAPDSAPLPPVDAELLQIDLLAPPDDEVPAPPAVTRPGAAGPITPAATVMLPATEVVAGHVVAASFTNMAGTRAYKLYVPSESHLRPLPLVVMLHGCRQDPDDFAAGTRMNELAEADGWFVLYPGQDRRANHLGCWNWFHESNQLRGRGEPSIIADMTRHVIATQPVDPQRVYIAGLSAGGAMSSIMAATYPELYAAAGIHSGLPHAAARDLASALKAMRHGPGARVENAAPEPRRNVPTIVFHGDLDTTVHPDNGDEVIAQARWASSARSNGDVDAAADVSVEPGEVPGGHAFSRTIHRDEQGRCDAEHWVIHGAGHAWSGGSGNGSYTDPAGPDASREMLRFFLEHPFTD